MSCAPKQSDLRLPKATPVNDNRPAAPSGFSLLDIIQADDAFGQIATRAERLGIAVIIGMALILIVGPVVFVMFGI